MARAINYEFLLAAGLTLVGGYVAATTPDPTHKNWAILATGVGAGLLIPHII